MSAFEAPYLVVGIRVKTKKGRGTIRYIGPTTKKQGTWVGIELDDPVGYNNGTVEGSTYFCCDDHHGIFVPPQGVKPTFRVGDYVNTRHGTGTIRYLGAVAHKKGQWIGVELSDGGGKNDGSVDGRKYFKCPPDCGVFVKKRHVQMIPEGTFNKEAFCASNLPSYQVMYGEDGESSEDTGDSEALLLPADDA